MPAQFSQPLVLLSAQSADETKSNPVAVNNANKLMAAVEWGPGTSAGVVELEGAMSSDYGGLWHQIKVFTWAAASKVEVHTEEKHYDFVRFRISTAIVGGTINAKLQVYNAE